MRALVKPNHRAPVDDALLATLCACFTTATSIIRMPGLKHRIKTSRLLLATPLDAGLLKPPMLPHQLHCLLTIQLLLEPPQCSVYRFAFFQFYFNHNYFFDC